jgi:hypothetical protein
MKVKNIILNTCIGLILCSAFIISCSEDEDSQPIITNVRVTVKDSTITSGDFNLVVAIQGTGLEGVQKVLFNDVEADLKPVYVTSTNIICAVPDSPPSELLNKITVVTASGKSTSYDFTVILPDPVVSAVYNEFAKPSSENRVLGNYFYFVSKVLVGEEEVQITKFTATEITFTMPDDDVSGKTVTVVSAGGTAASTFKFPTALEGNMVNFDVAATPWGSDVCWGDAERIDPGNSELEVLSGRYTRIKQSNLPKSGFQSNWVISTCNNGQAINFFKLPSASHETKMLKFEHYVVETWKAGYYDIVLTTNDNVSYTYQFKPWDSDEYRTSGYTTKGWRTAYIPVSNFKSSSGAQIADISVLNDFQFIFKTPDATIDNFYTAADNFRIVDK